MTSDSCGWKKACGGTSHESAHGSPEKGGGPLDTPPHTAPRFTGFRPRLSPAAARAAFAGGLGRSGSRTPSPLR